MKRLIGIMLICITLIFAGCASVLNEETSKEEEKLLEERLSEDLRSQYTTIKGNGEDVVTIMVYMIGSDLEADGLGCASADIEEMLEAHLSENVNLILQTGGTTSWENPNIKGGSCQRFMIKDGQLAEIADLGCINMVEPKSVTDFIKWASKNYEADRYELIFWDHGGGTEMGYGRDMYYKDEMLELPEIGQAIKKSGIKFDFIGFDACLMGTIETAYMLEKYADYLIASEETEPESGWEYTRWLNAISNNTSIATLELGHMIIDDYVGGWNKIFDDCTLSIIELREIPNTYRVLCRYMADSTVVLENYGFKNLSEARATAKSFGEGDYEQIDIIDYVNKAQVAGKDKVKAAVRAAVKYTNNNTDNTYGLAMYYPYNALEYYEMVSQEMAAYDYGDECTAFFNKFVSILADGQMRSTGIKSKNEALTGMPAESNYIDYTQYTWYEPEEGEAYTNVYETTIYEEREIIDTGEYYILPMSDEDWDLITYIEQQVFIDDGLGYIDLGADNVYEVDEEGNLKVDFDYKWVAIEGTIVPFYAEKEVDVSEKDWYTYGYVPAVLNNEDEIQIILCWDAEHEKGYVAGYRESGEEITVAAKGLKQLKKDDKIDFICDYYTYEGEYESSYYFGQPIIVKDAPLTVSYENIGDEKVEVCFRLTDIYQNNFWTETVRYEIDE